MKSETIGFLRNQAKIAFKALPVGDRLRMGGSYKPLYLEFKSAWKGGCRIELPVDWKEKMEVAEV